MKIASIIVIAWLATSAEGRLLRGKGRGKNKGGSSTPWREQPDTTTAATDAPPVTSLPPRYVRMSNKHMLYVV